MGRMTSKIALLNDKITKRKKNRILMLGLDSAGEFIFLIYVRVYLSAYLYTCTYVYVIKILYSEHLPSRNDSNYTHTHTHTRTQIYHHHHHHVIPPALISLTLSRHFSLSFIASGRSSGLHLVSSQS